MDATRDDLVQFVSAIRCKLHGRNGLVRDPVQTETLDQLRRQLVCLMMDKEAFEVRAEHLKARVEDLSRSVITPDA